MAVIFHLDMDAFYAAIEQLDQPALRGRPVIVGGPVKRGVVSTASYEARPFGVHSAMPMARALQLCPQAVVLPVRMERYAAVSRQLMEVLAGYSPRIEPLSQDEAFLDMSGTERMFGPPPVAARRIQQHVARATGLSCSVGVAGNKFLAKLASDLDKPGGITCVPCGREREFIAPLPVRRIWGVGPKAAGRLERLGLRRIGDVAAADPAWLEAELGGLGAHIHALACGLDQRPVLAERERKSVGSEHTLEHDIHGRGPVEQHLRQACERVARHLRRQRLRAPRGAGQAALRRQLPAGHPRRPAAAGLRRLGHPVRHRPRAAGATGSTSTDPPGGRGRHPADRTGPAGPGRPVRRSAVRAPGPAGADPGRHPRSLRGTDRTRRWALR